MKWLSKWWVMMFVAPMAATLVVIGISYLHMNLISAGAYTKQGDSAVSYAYGVFIANMGFTALLASPFLARAVERFGFNQREGRLHGYLTLAVLVLVIGTVRSLPPLLGSISEARLQAAQASTAE